MNVETKQRSGVFVRVLVPVCLILIGVSVFWYYRSHRVQVGRKSVQFRIPVVETMQVFPGDCPAHIHAMGTVIAEKKVVLVQVSPGFARGRVVEKGQLLLGIDDTDYVLEKQKAASALEQALVELEMEKGRQQIAQKELELASRGNTVSLENTDLALRKPQLRKARALVENARADVKKAQLHIARTRIVAPFTALILEKQIDLGALVSSQSPLATLVAVDSYQVEALIPFDQLARLIMDPEKGSRTMISSFDGKGSWQGKVVGTTGKVADKTRMAAVLIHISDPLGRKNPGASPGLLLGDYVRIQISGRPLKQVFSLPRSVIHENNTVWVVKDDCLAILSVTPVWKEKDRVFIADGLSSDDKIITSDLAVPMPGMALKVKE